MLTTLPERRSPMPSNKQQINFRISPNGKKILDALMDRFGTTQAGVFERLLRDEEVRLQKAEGWTASKTLSSKRL